MLTTTACGYCGGSVTRPVGEEEQHIWGRLSLETGIWCAGCGGTKEIKREITFCSPTCLQEYVMSPSFQRWKDKIGKEAAEAAKRIREC